MVARCVDVRHRVPSLPHSGRRRHFQAQIGPVFRYLIRRNPPMSLWVAYRRVLGLIAYGLFRNPFEVRCVFLSPGVESGTLNIKLSL